MPPRMPLLKPKMPIYDDREESARIGRAAKKNKRKVAVVIKEIRSLTRAIKAEVGSDGSKDSTHYGGADNPHEVIKCLEAWGLERDALLWNAVKYVSRAGKKIEQPLLKDLKKALYYLKRRVEKMEAAEAAAKPKGRKK